MKFEGRNRHMDTLREALVGADVFIGVSAPHLLTGDDIATMARDAIVFALANPTPEVDPVAAGAHAAVVATELSAAYIVPSAFDASVAPAAAEAVRSVAERERATV